MSDRIMIKRLNQKPTQEDLAQLWGVVVSWIEHKKPTCPESIYQNDICSSNVLEFVEEVCDVVGYWDK